MVLDHLYGKEGNRLTPLFHLQTDLGVDLDKKSIQGKKNNLQIQALCPTKMWQCTDWSWRGNNINTITWRTQVDEVQTIHPLLLSFGDAEASYTLEGDVFNLRLNGSDYRIHLADGRVI